MGANSLSSRTVYTEIIYNVSASRNIGKALSGFGVSDVCSSVLFVLHRPSVSSISAVRAAVDGEEVEDVEAGLREGADLDKIRAAYDIGKQEEAGGMVNAIVTRIAIRDVR